MAITPFTETVSFTFFVAVITTTLTLAVINGRLLDQRSKFLAIKELNDDNKRSFKHVMWNLEVFACLIMSQLFLSVSLLGRILLNMIGNVYWELDFLLIFWQGINLVFWIRIFSQYCYHTFIDPKRRKIPN